MRDKHDTIRMKHLITSLLLMTCALSAHGETTDQSVLLRIGGHPITRGEFLYAYNKNQAVQAGEKKMTAREYVDLFVNYKLKVLAAEALGLDTLASFRNEFRSYRDELVSKRLIDQHYIDSTAQARYNRELQLLDGKDLLTVSHILLRVPTLAGPEERQKIASRADSLYRLLVGGADFGTLARQYSEDLASKNNGGLLPIITAGATLKAFEDKVYALREGELSLPFQTEVGYHIAKLIKRQAPPSFQTAYPHLLSRLKQEGIEEKAAEHTLERLMGQHHQTRDQALDSLSNVGAAADPQLRYLIQEYHDGLLLFEAEKNNVWNAAAQDSVALEKMFRSNRKKYRWNAPHFKGFVLSSNDADALRAAQALLNKGVPVGMEAMDLLKNSVNKDSVRVKVAGPYLVERGENSTIDHFAFKDKKAAARSVAAGMKYTTVSGRIEKRPTSYADVRSQVLEDVQQAREQEWLSQLHKQYRVQLYPHVLETINHPNKH